MDGQGGAERGYRPSAEFLSLWPGVSGNSINGLGETTKRRPTPVFWRPDGTVEHRDIQAFFYQYDRDNKAIAEARLLRQQTQSIPVHEIADPPEERSAADWAEAVKKAALDVGADIVGICEYRPEWTYDDREQPRGKWVVVMGFTQDYEAMSAAPHEKSYIEVMRQYARAGDAAKNLANWIRDRGHYAEGKTGPNTEDVMMIPAAIEAGLGELGKHGSMINRSLGANFRLSLVLTDLPLVPDRPDIFGADDFCASCQVCTRACPPDAIEPDKQTVRGETKWYVDFDKCVAFFIENKTCGICLAVCPWSRPGVADNLVAKMARRRDASSKEA